VKKKHRWKAARKIKDENKYLRNFREENVIRTKEGKRENKTERKLFFKSEIVVWIEEQEIGGREKEEGAAK
jgi:hypothetical protein